MLFLEKLYLPGTEGLNELVEVFWRLYPVYLMDHLIENIFGMSFIKKDEIELKIEQILHPKILHKMNASMEFCQEGIMIVVIPLLVEKRIMGTI